MNENWLIYELFENIFFYLLFQKIFNAERKKGKLSLSPCFFHIQKCFGKFALTVYQSKEKKGEREMLVNSIKKKTRQLTIGESFSLFFLLWESSERIYLLPFSSESSDIVRFSCKPHHRNTKYCGGIVEHDSLPWHVQRGSRADKWLAKSCDSGRWPIAAAARHDGAPHLALHRPFFFITHFFLAVL